MKSVYKFILYFYILLSVNTYALNLSFYTPEKSKSPFEYSYRSDSQVNNNLPPAKISNKIPLTEIERFSNVVALIRHYYIKEVSYKELFNHAIDGMLSQLDPHSSFIDENEISDFETITFGNIGGVGIEVMPDNGVIKVVSPVEGTPAYKAGIKAGDYIIKIDDKLVRNMSLSQAVKLMRGPKNSKLSLTIVRPGIAKPLDFHLIRDIIKIDTTKANLINNYLYIRIPLFNSFTSDDLIKEIKKYSGRFNGLILDLRNNPGGLLDSAVKVADTFLDSNKLKSYHNLIVYTKGRDKESDLQVKMSSGDLLNGLPIAILVNYGSASASEIVAGALQDYKRAVIVGTTSFGKGSVQTVFPLNNNSAVKLTTALYYTPSGRSIQLAGIIPDVVVPEAKLVNDQLNASKSMNVSEVYLANHIKLSAIDKATNNKIKSNYDKLKAGDVSQDNANVIVNKENYIDMANKDYQLFEALNLLRAINATRI